MGVSAQQGPLVVYGIRPPPGNVSNNPAAAPSMIYGGVGLLDPRAGYNVTALGAIGWYGLGLTATIDQAPSTATTTAIAAAQVPVAGTALTLVSSTGAGITVLASALQVWGSGNTIPANTLAIDGAPGLVGTGVAVVSTGNSRIRWYDPTKAVARAVTIKTNGDDTGATFTVAGYDLYGYAMTQTVTGVNNSTVTTTKAFKFIASVTPAGTLSGSNVSVGQADVFGFPLAVSSGAYTKIRWGTPATERVASIDSTASRSTIILPIASMAGIVNSQLYEAAMPFDGKIVSALFRDTVAISTGAKAATLTVQANGSSVTGGVIAVAGTYATGATQAGTTITAGNTFLAGQTVGVIASSVTTFSEGAGYVELTVENTDLAGGTITAADTTSPATASTGDVRGTYAPPSAADATKKLEVFITPTLAQVANTTSLATGIFGVLQV